MNWLLGKVISLSHRTQTRKVYRGHRTRLRGPGLGHVVLSLVLLTAQAPPPSTCQRTMADNGEAL